jgi:outer membrane biosynthesis protein TonB
VAAQIDEPAPELVQTAEPEPAPEPVEAPKAKRSHHKKAAPETAPEPVQATEPEPEPQAEPASAEPVPAETPNAPTIDDVRTVGVKLGAAGKQSVIIDYLKAHGCKSLSQLDPGCYAELIGIGKAAL